MTKLLHGSLSSRGKTPTILAATMALLFLGASPALALVSVTNGDSKEHTITFDKGEQEIQKKVAPGKSVSEKCSSPCGVRNSVLGYDYIAQDGDKLMIKDNFIKSIKTTGS